MLIYQKTLEHVTKGKIESYYDRHKDSFQTALLAHIIVGDLSLAEELVDRAKSHPEQWAALALEHSLDLETADTAGWLGLVRSSELQPEISELIFSAKAGDILGPFKIQDRLEIILVHDVRTAQLDEKTRERICEILFKEWLAELRKNVDLHWYWYQK